ncbi:hypothetical protein FE257_009755 [Aspergillus nanangensis]|uniref:Cytochrome P450 n=1 Tax=Aspergillus nanangensis TaxID=2582783 RepID=A0AAD4CJY1_ASPNN|nr:hypothetical protein FE257_009755 [Aspergillus nanangensis]
MGKYTITSDALFQSAQSNVNELAWTIVLAILVLCTVTRIVTNLQSRADSTTNAEPRSVKTVAYWVPWVGHGSSFLWNHINLIGKARDSRKEPVLGIYMGGAKHNFVVSPSMIKSVMIPENTSSASMINHALKTVGGDQGPIRNLSPADHQVFHHNLPNLFTREPFTTQASEAMVQLIQRETPNLVTFCRSVVDQAPWERGSGVMIAEGHDQPACEANLFALIRGFVGHITTSTLMGHAILEAFPHLLDDIWLFDNRFPLLAMGLPRWLPLPGLPAAYAARDRVLGSLAAFHQAFVQLEDGIDPDVKLRELDDVSEPIKQRIRMSKELGFSAKTSAPGHLILFWAMNGNTPNIVFWNLLRLYTNPTLLEEIRKEIAPYVKMSRPTREKTGFPIPEAPKVSMDLDGLFKKCHLLKGSFYETMRVDSAGFLFREAIADLTITESEEDATIAGFSEPRSVRISKGESVAVPHGVLHNDPRYFSNPGQFDPLRFITTDPTTGVKRADMHTINPFGDGMAAYKGPVFAEREILAFVVPIISMWNIEPAEGEQLILPRHKLSGGTYLPSRDIPVRLSMRI